MSNKLKSAQSANTRLKLSQEPNPVLQKQQANSAKALSLQSDAKHPNLEVTHEPLWGVLSVIGYEHGKGQDNRVPF